MAYVKLVLLSVFLLSTFVTFWTKKVEANCVSFCRPTDPCHAYNCICAPTILPPYGICIPILYKDAVKIVGKNLICQDDTEWFVVAFSGGVVSVSGGFVSVSGGFGEGVVAFDWVLTVVVLLWLWWLCGGFRFLVFCCFGVGILHHFCRKRGFGVGMVMVLVLVLSISPSQSIPSSISLISIAASFFLPVSLHVFRFLFSPSQQTSINLLFFDFIFFDFGKKGCNHFDWLDEELTARGK
ncbi:hypothetical protein P8452_59683 [Trifolium repens]|nr:hypothetical protein P8452_59683 [Trifolium repens]